MNKVIRAALSGFMAVWLLMAPGALAEEPMVVASEVEAASLPEDYEGAMGLLEELISSMVEEESTPADAEETEITEEATPVPTAVPIPTEEPAEEITPYDVSFVLPSGWTNASRGTVTIQIADPGNLGLTKAEYNAGSGWQDVTTEYFMSRDGKINISVTENGTLNVRLTDPHGHVFEESTEVRCFDRIEPWLQASIRGENLHVQATDQDSEVAGIQVNGLLFTAIDNGTLDIHIPDVLSNYDHLAVRAFDYAGNFSDPVTIDNPYYVEPTSTPQKTPKPTAASATEVPADPTEEPIYIPGITAEPVITAEPTPQIIYVQPEATPTPIVETEYITIGPGMPYLADGNGHTLDVLYSAATNKQFITMQTKSGNVFYLVIDYDKPIDEAAEMYETYFLNLVDERDLMALMSEEEMPTATPQVIYVTPEPTMQPTPTPTPTAAPETHAEPAEKEKSPIVGIAAIVALLAVGGGVFYFLKVKGKGQNAKSSSGYDLDEDDDDEEEEDESNTET